MTRGGKREGAGRKKGFAAIEAEKARALISERLSTNLLPIVDKAIEQAKEGDRSARDWLTDRAYGRAVQSIEADITTDEEKVSFTDEQFRQIIRTASERLDSDSSSPEGVS